MYAPAGLGHLRVTDALYHGLPKSVNKPVILGADDVVIAFLHRFISVHYLTRMLMEIMQKGFLENVTTFLYRFLLRSNTKPLAQQLTRSIQTASIHPKTVLVIATHFGQAHQLEKIKKRLEQQTHTKIILVVQVTDDSPQHLWYVPGADLICVPSQTTKKSLTHYGLSLKLPLVPLVVLPYPIDPSLKKILPQTVMKKRTQQVETDSNTAIDILIPISGAAIGLSFFTTLMQVLRQKSDRFMFHVVCKKAPFTRNFIAQAKRSPSIHMHAASSDREVIDTYEDVYQKEVISLEITKPSEQAFKALLDCERRGASLLLFTQPVGRQEEDNLDFLKRHNLIPQDEATHMLWGMAEKNEKPSDVWIQKAASWRGVSLPTNAKKAGEFIYWCLQEGIFSAMMTCKMVLDPNDPHAQELSPNGVEAFWQQVADLIEKSK